MNTPDLDQLAIATPCSMKWDDLVGDDRKRYCGACRLHVYDFAAMTRREVAEVVTTTDERVCARLFRRADGTILTRDCGPVRERLARRLRRIRIAAAALLGTFGTFALAACGVRSSEHPPITSPPVGPDVPAAPEDPTASETPETPESCGELLGEVGAPLEEMGDVLIPQERLGRIALPPKPAPEQPRR